jgi:hypothetical protein
VCATWSPRRGRLDRAYDAQVHEVAFEDLIHGQVVIAFDGRVVECFKQGRGSIARIHLQQLLCEARGPSPKGHYEVKFSIAPWGGGFDLTVAGETWRRLQPLVAEIYAANR